MADAVPLTVPVSFATTAINTRIAFLTELARRLHQYGTTAPRLETAIGRSAQRLGLAAEVWSSPTAIIVSFADLGQGEESVAQVTQVMRLPRATSTSVASAKPIALPMR